jgi:hypothetical protein
LSLISGIVFKERVMKKIITSFITFQFFWFSSFSQQSAADTMVTNVLDIAWMPNGKSLCFAVIRGDKATS